MRFYNISNSPPSMNWDEAALGYNAYSILRTAKDEYGAKLPLITRSFDDYKSALPIYPMVVTIAMFGLNEFAVRAPTAFWGTLTIVLIYLLAKRLLKSESAATLAALFFAIEPWSVHFSRVYHEATFALFFYLLMCLLFLASAKTNKLIFWAIISGIISLFSYHTNKVLVPITFLGFWVLYRKQINAYSKKIKLASVIFLVIGGVVFVQQILFGNALARAESASILRAEKLVELPVQIIRRYFLYFSPSNLFVYEPKEPASVVPGNSTFYPFEIIFWLIGLTFLAVKFKKNKTFVFLMFIAPVTASFTWNLFEPARVLSLFSLFSILIGLGASLVWKKSKPLFKIFLVIFFGILIPMSTLYLFDSINYKIAARDYGSWQPGFRESMPTVYQKSFDFKQVVVDTPHAQPYIFVLFYSSYPPQKYLQELDLLKIGNPRKVYDFGKYIFRSLNFSKDKKDPDNLYVIWKGSAAFDQFSDDELAYIKEVENVNNDTIVKIVAFIKQDEK